jgi:hypothetical protein
MSSSRAHFIIVEIVDGVLTEAVFVHPPYQMMITLASPITQPFCQVISGSKPAVLIAPLRPGTDRIGEL